MKKFINKIAVISSLVLGATVGFAQSAESALELSEFSINASELQLKFLDAQDVPNVCDYALTRLELIESIDTLIVQLAAPKPCLVDRYGKRKGSLKWNLPAKYRRNAKLRVLVNDQILGTLIISNGSLSFQKK